MKTFASYTFVSLILRTSFASDSINFVPVGCFHDNQEKPRPLPELIYNYRLNDEMDWDDLQSSVIEACAREARSRNYLYFGVQFYGECWSGPRAHKTYSKDGASSECTSGVGREWANMVYRLTGDENECINYKIFDTEDRSGLIETSIISKCDNSGFQAGWYRFQGKAGTRLNDKMTRNRCQTGTMAWYPGPHPDVTQGVLTGEEVCITETCSYSMDIRIRNCGGFFVYYLKPIPGCYFRYCGNEPLSVFAFVWPFLSSTLLRFCIFAKGIDVEDTDDKR